MRSVALKSQPQPINTISIPAFPFKGKEFKALPFKGRVGWGWCCLRLDRIVAAAKNLRTAAVYMPGSCLNRLMAEAVW